MSTPASSLGSSDASSEPAVTLRELRRDIVQVTMQDRVNKNTFSEAILSGLGDAFARIGRNPEYKAVILTGYDTYFCSGGTQEALMALQESRDRKFTDVSITYQLALECPIPVISAMQGHGIGGGLVMGLYADFIIFSRESVYCTNFMKYGFTPGMGGTYIVPLKLGLSLGTELLMTAANYRGADLEKRGVPCPVVPRNEVLDNAYRLAETLAEKPRVSLATLKQHLVAPIRAALPDVITREVEMHAKTFHQPEVRQRIQSLFGQ